MWTDQRMDLNLRFQIPMWVLCQWSDLKAVTATLACILKERWMLRSSLSWSIQWWQKEKRQEILSIARKGNFAVGWVPSHQVDGGSPGEWNNWVDELARLAPVQKETKFQKIGNAC